MNPIDWKIARGLFAAGQPLEGPRGIGVDVAGIVEQVGPGVSAVLPGQELLGAPISPSFAELALSRPELLVPKPPGIPWEVAGSLAVVVGTAYATLARLALSEGETLLVLGASGGVGAVVVQLALARGVRVIGTAGESKLERLQALGAIPVAYGEGLAERLAEAVEEVLPLIESGRIEFPIAGVYDLGQVGDALRESEHGHPAGKLVVVPQ